MSTLVHSSLIISSMLLCECALLTQYDLVIMSKDVAVLDWECSAQHNIYCEVSSSCNICILHMKAYDSSL
ncbi:hypothetical protein C0J52_06984 [Blattella germanica]|nr:hypothetical protein C0J52_06984 [Blattella germanica]